MGTKRPFAATDPPVPGEASDSSKRRKKLGQARHKAREGSSSYSKKRARNIERLLQRNQELPANVRNELERELAARKSDINDRLFRKKRSAMIAKYHMVRFFERQKASRLVRQLSRQMESDPASNEVERLKEKLHIAEVDEAYATYFPHYEPYVSLYGSQRSKQEEDKAGKESSAKATLGAQRPPMWTVIEKTMEEGPEALRRLRERRPVDAPRARPGTMKKSAAKSPSRKGIGEKSSAVPATEKQPLKPVPRSGHSRDTVSAPVEEKVPAQTRQLNRRERRRLMRQTMAAASNSDQEDEDGGFFDEV